MRFYSDITKEFYKSPKACMEAEKQHEEQESKRKKEEEEFQARRREIIEAICKNCEEYNTLIAEFYALTKERTKNIFRVGNTVFSFNSLFDDEL